MRVFICPEGHSMRVNPKDVEGDRVTCPKCGTVTQLTNSQIVTPAGDG